MTGMDYHRDSYRVAKEKVDAADLDVELHDGNLKKVLPTFADDTFDAALSIEVLHTSRDLQADLAQLFRVVRPGGLLMITHRPKFYNIARCLAEGCPEDAVMVATTPQGRLKKAHHRIHYNWQSRREIETLYRQLGGTPEVLYPIGTFSGFLSDPLTTVCDPGTLDARQQAMLRQIETGVDDELLMASRYVLAVVRKNESSTE
jgi:SAM-dependent methyltransferase